MDKCGIFPVAAVCLLQGYGNQNEKNYC